jgi:hypothetical protein
VVGSTGISAGLSESAEEPVGKLLGGIGMPLIAALGFWQLQQICRNIALAEYIG